MSTSDTPIDLLHDVMEWLDACNDHGQAGVLNRLIEETGFSARAGAFLRDSSHFLKENRAVGMLDNNSLHCPYCGEAVDEDTEYVEDMACTRRCLSFDNVPDRARGTTSYVLNVDGFYETEGWEEFATDPRLLCDGCNKQFNLPPEIEVEFR